LPHAREHTAKVPDHPSDAPPTTEERAALSEDVELDPEMRARIVDTYRTLERSSHYEVLGLERTAETKAVKRAYYELAATFHPDRYFRKKLGSFKFRMEAIFGRLTLAHDTLSNKEKRTEYDDYLDDRLRSGEMVRILSEGAAEAQRARATIEREARALSPLPDAHPEPGSPAAPVERVSPPPPASAGPPPPATRTPSALDVATRRDSLARRLLGGRSVATAPSSNPPPSGPAPPPSSTHQAAASAMESLRRRYDERVRLANAAQSHKYATSGEEALAAGNAVAAANAFRIALSLSPADAGVERAALHAQTQADAVLGETYSRQAAYEEKNAQWTQAARSWTRVCKTRPNDPDSHERAASAIVKGGGDLHEAARLAAHACTLVPGCARYRVTLANVYLAAGLALNARRELETAAQLAPHDDTITAMMRRLGK
jgi:curved DNA-binding protein CbpA